MDDFSKTEDRTSSLLRDNTDEATPLTALSEPIDSEYRPIVFKIFYLILLATIFSELIIIRINYHEIFYVAWSTGIIKLILSSMLPMTILFRTLFIFLPRIYCKYHAEKDKIIISSYRKKREILYSQIALVKLSTFSPRFFGRFSVILKSGTKFRFPSLIKKNHLFLQAIYQSRPDLIAEKNFNYFMQISEILEISWIRIFDKLKKWQLLLIKFIVLPLALSIIIYLKNYRLDDNFSVMDTMLALFLIFFSANLLLAFIFNLVEERINNRHIIFKAEKANVPIARDVSFEKKASIWIQSLFYISVVSLFFLFLNNS